MIDNLLKGAAGSAVQNFNVMWASTSGRDCCDPMKGLTVLKLGGELLEDLRR